MKRVVILEQEEYDELFRQASSNVESIKEQAVKALDAVIDNLKKMHNSVHPAQLADFLERRRDLFVKESVSNLK